MPISDTSRSVADDGAGATGTYDPAWRLAVVARRRQCQRTQIVLTFTNSRGCRAHAQFTAVAGIFYSAERQARVAVHHAVHKPQPGVDGAHEPFGAGGIA